MQCAHCCFGGFCDAVFFFHRTCMMIEWNNFGVTVIALVALCQCCWGTFRSQSITLTCLNLPMPTLHGFLNANDPCSDTISCWLLWCCCSGTRRPCCSLMLQWLRSSGIIGEMCWGQHVGSSADVWPLDNKRWGDWKPDLWKVDLVRKVMKQWHISALISAD